LQTVVRLIGSLGGAFRKWSNKRSSIPLWKKYHIVVSFNSKNGTKVANLISQERNWRQLWKTKTKNFLTLFYQNIRENTIQ